LQGPIDKACHIPQSYGHASTSIDSQSSIRYQNGGEQFDPSGGWPRSINLR
jgi:hypothetical protein